MTVHYATTRHLCFEDVEVGAALEVVKHLTIVQLLRFSAAIWNAHRIDYDAEYDRSEGHPDAHVQSHVHGNFFVETVTAWAGPRGRNQEDALRAPAWAAAELPSRETGRR